MPLSQHLQPDTSAARLTRVWAGVRGGLDRAQPPRRWAGIAFALGAVAVACGAVAFAVHRGEPPSSALENAALETASDTLGVTLLDGSQLTLDSRTRVQVAGGNAQAVSLVVAHGRISCDVTHRPGRSFVVRASGVEIRVVGTRFSVTDELRADGAHIDVRVERGVVEIVSERHPGQVTRVAAGQSFSEWAPPQGAAVVSAPTPTPTPTPTSEVATAPVPDASTAPAPSRAVDPQRATAEETARAAHEPTARDLFDAANVARRAGDARAAADDYGQLLKKFPGDGRAGLAAFELGRLRMDRLGDLAGAVQALERAVQLAPGSGFREDAMARLVTAYAATGRSVDCVHSRDAYLAAYPAGVHRDAVTRGCGLR